MDAGGRLVYSCTCKIHQARLQTLLYRPTRGSHDSHVAGIGFYFFPMHVALPALDER